MFSCRDATELMTDAGEGTLTGGRRTLFRVHMFVCGHCRAFRRQLALAIDVAREIPRDEVPRDAEEKLAAAFRARRG